MRVVTKEFLNENSYISYPIDFRATYEPYSKEDVSAINSILLDMKLTIPEDVATTAFIASIKVTPALVSLIIMGSKENPYYDVVPPTPTYTSEEYDAFSAIVLATIAVPKSTAIQQNPVRLVSAVEGVGGWVVFGPGVQTNGNWSFNGPTSSAVASSAITRYKYGGVKSLAKKGFEQTVDGLTFIAGQNGIEVVQSGPDVISIQFSGTTLDVKDGLSEYRGLCGIRPETDTCTFTPIKSVNNIPPKTNTSGINEVVLVLDLPLYGGFRNIVAPNGTNITNGGFTVSSDVPLESLCPRRLDIPDIECQDPVNLQTAQVVAPTAAFGTQIMLEVATSTSGAQSHVFTMYQQHPTRKSVSVFRPDRPVTLLDEGIFELHLDHSSMQWQAYTAVGPSLKIYGPIEANLSGHRAIIINDINVRMAIARLNVLDRLNFNTVKINVDSVDIPEWAGNYVRQYVGYYANEINKDYVLRMSPLNNSWSIGFKGAVVVGGTFDDKGIAIHTQNYKDSNRVSKIRSVTAAGVNQ
jgi:hypothetical protein